MTGPRMQDVQDIVTVPLYTDGSPQWFEVGSTGNSYGSAYPDPQLGSLLYNCFAQKLPDGSYEVTKRHGLVGRPLGVSSKLGTIVGAMSMQAIAGADIVAILNGTTVWIVQMPEDFAGTGEVVIGSFTISGTLRQVYITEIMVDSKPGIAVSWNAVNLATNNTGWYAITTAGAFTPASLTQIVDVDYPGNIAGEQTVGAFVQLNTHIFIMGRSGKIYNGDGDTAGSNVAITSWGGAAFQIAQMDPDKGLGLCKYKHMMVAFGETSIEFFVDAGLAPPGSPLDRVKEATIRMGLANPDAFVSIDDVIYFVARSNRGGSGLWKIEQYTPTKISNAHWDKFFVASRNYFSLRFFVVNNTRHLAFCPTSALDGNMLLSPYMSQAAYVRTDTSNGNETYPFPAAIQIGGTVPICPLFLGMPAYNITHDTWWILNWFDTQALYNVFYCVQRALMTSVAIPEVHYYIQGPGDASHVYVYDLGDAAGSDPFCDTDGIGSAYPVVWGIQLQSLDFDTEHTKKLHKLRIMGLQGIEKYMNDSSTGDSIYVGISKNDTVGKHAAYDSIPDIVRNIPIPKTTQRYELANIGTARHWTFWLTSRSKMPFRATGLELTMSLGTD